MIKKATSLILLSCLIVAISDFLTKVRAETKSKEYVTAVSIVRDYIYNLPNPLNYKGLPILPTIFMWATITLIIFLTYYFISVIYLNIYNYLVIKTTYRESSTTGEPIYKKIYKKILFHYGLIAVSLALIMGLLAIAIYATSHIIVYIQGLLTSTSLKDSATNTFAINGLLVAFWLLCLLALQSLYHFLRKEQETIETIEEHDLSD